MKQPRTSGDKPPKISYDDLLTLVETTAYWRIRYIGLAEAIDRVLDMGVDSAAHEMLTTARQQFKAGGEFPDNAAEWKLLGALH